MSNHTSNAQPHGPRDGTPNASVQAQQREERIPRRNQSRAVDPAWATLVDDVKRWAHEQRFALWVVFGFIIINFVWWMWFAIQHRTLPYNELSTNLGDFDFSELIPSLFLTRSVYQLIVEAALMLIVLCLAEPILGAARTVLTCLLSAVGGVFVGVFLCAAVSALLSGSPDIFTISFTLSPVTLVIGGLMAASCFRHQLWRQRIRIIGYAAILVVLLYGGNPGDYCTLMAAIIGQIIGRVIAGPPPRSDQWHWQHTSSYETRHILGAIGIVLALGPVVAATSRSHAGPLTSMALLMSPQSVNTGRLAECMHGIATHGCYAQYALARSSMPGDILRSVLPLVVMFIIACGLYMGRRSAAWFNIVFYGLTALITLSYYLFVPFSTGTATHLSFPAIWTTVVNTAVPAVYAIIVALNIRHFSIRTNERDLRLGAAIIIATFTVCSLVYVGGAWLMRTQFDPQPGFAAIIAEWPSRFLPVGYLAHTKLMFMAHTAAASLLYQGVGIVFWLVLVIVAILWLRTSIDQDNRTRAHAEELVEAGGESMSFMTTWEGNDYWLSSTGRSAVAYRVLNGIALTTTGPFGDPDEWMADLDDFSRFANEHAWSPVFYAIHEAARDHLSKIGWHSLLVGEEMVIDPRAWKTTGKKWQDIRTAINKAKRDGIVDYFTTYDQCPPDVQEQFAEISEQWSQGKALPEMKFTLGGVEELKDPRVAVLYALDSNGVVQGVTSWLPTWRNGQVIGWTLDFMRHRTDSPNGIMEFLIARMAQRMHDEGEQDPQHAVEFVSLSAAPLAGLDSASDATSDDHSNVSGTTVLQHSLALVANMLEPAYGFKSLYNFKKKFQPQARPVYLSYADPAKLANIGIAILRAYLPNLTARQVIDMLKSFKDDHKSE